MLSRAEVFRIHVTGISDGVEVIDLVENFETFGKIYEISFDPSISFDNYAALISYTNQKDAILAIAKGHELKIGVFDIMVEWARGWPINRSRRKNFRDIFDATSENNSTVYINGLDGQNSREVLESIFSPFGMIEEIFTKSSWSDYALIRFSDKWDACNAIHTIDGTRVDGLPVSCTWSHRENTQSVTTGGHSSAMPIERAPMQVPLLRPTTITKLRTPAASSSAINSTLSSSTSGSATNSALSSSTSGRATNSALSSSISGSATNPTLSSSTSGSATNSALSSGTSTESIAILQRFFHRLLDRSREIEESTAVSSSDNLTTSTASAAFDSSESSSTLENAGNTIDNFDTVFNQTRQNNCTVYCKGLNLRTTNESLKNIFSSFGIIEEIGLYVDRSDYALIRFNTKEAATLAICSINNTKINGCRVKCTWSNNPNFWNNHRAQSASVGHPPSTTSTPCSSQIASVASLPPATKKDETGSIEKVKERTSDILCKICMDEELGVVFLPCGHLTACAKCARQIFTCPLCRKSITSKVRTYLG